MMHSYQTYPLFSYFKTHFSTLAHLCRTFEHKHPLFIGALYWFGGIFSRAFPFSALALLLFLSLFIPRNNPKKQLFLALLWILPSLTIPYSPPHCGEAQGVFFIKSVSRYPSNYYHTYDAELAPLTMLCCKKTYPPLVCRIQSKRPLSPGKKYSAQGYLSMRGPFLTFTPRFPITPQPLSPFCKHKQAIRTSLHQKICSRFPDADQAAFASSLLLGFPLPPALRSLFQQKGLSHIFVVSGWHFSLFFLLFAFILKAFPFRYSPPIMLLAFSLITYVFPWSPSVCRAWISYTLFCCSLLTQGHASSLNRLGGAAIVCSLFFSPLSPSFVLSFLATLGIVLFYQPIFQFLISPWEELLPPICFKGVSYLCSAFTLSLSSQLFICIPVLAFFKFLPLDGLILNLFFPLLIFPIFFLIIFSLALPILAPLTQTAIQCILSLPILHAPNMLISLRATPKISLYFTAVSLLLLLLGVLLQKKHIQQSDSETLLAIL